MPLNDERHYTDAGAAIYRIPDYRFIGLAERVQKLNRRAARLRMEPLELTTIAEEFEERKITRNDRTVKITVKVILVTLTGKCPRVNGWAMAATIQHEDGGNLLRTVPGFEKLLPLKHRTCDPGCDHCHADRRRRDTYVLQNGDMWMQVGRNCLADFLRTEDASGMAEWAEILASLDDELGEMEDESEFSGGGSEPQYWKTEVLLSQVAAVVRSDGWCSRGESKNQFGKVATVDVALSLLDPKRWARLTATDQERLAVTLGDETRANEAIAWARELPADVENDYLWNIRVVSAKEHISWREAGLAGSIIAAHNKHLEREMARKYERDAPSEWFGVIGQRDVFTLRVMATREMEGNFGLTTLVMFRDSAGNRAKWFCSGATEFDVDSEYVVKATVKEHQIYKDRKETLLSRVAVHVPPVKKERKKKADRLAAPALEEVCV